jgi:tape measure domain-containing protein
MAETLGQAVLEVGIDDTRLRAGLQGIEQQTRKTGEAIGRGLGSSNTIAGLNAQLEKVRDRLEKTAIGTKAFRDLQAEAKRLEGDLSRVGVKAEGLGRTFNTVRNTLAGLGVAAVFQDLIKSATELENITRKLSNTLGDDGTKEAISFLRGLSDGLGLSFNVLADSFGSFTAAASAANIPLSEQKDLFAAVSTSAQRLGLSNDAINGSLLALQQIASKGNVQMEELRGQLGERLPTAFAAAASGLGVTNAELIKLVESGKLTAEQFFPALTKGLNELNGSGGSALPTATQNFASLGNEIEKLKASVGQDLLPGVLAFIEAIASTLQGKLQSELVSVNNAVAFLKDIIADQTEFGIDTEEAKRKLSELQLQAEEIKTKLGELNRVEEIKKEALALEVQRRELERQGVATDVLTEKTKLLAQELFLLTGSNAPVIIGQVGVEQFSLTPVVTEQLKETRAEQEKINLQLEIQQAARERLITAGRDTAKVDAEILALQERTRALRTGLGVAVLDRIQREKDERIRAAREEQASDAKRLDTADKINERLKAARKELGGLTVGSSEAREKEKEIKDLEAQTTKGAKSLEEAAKKIREGIEKGAEKLDNAFDKYENAIVKEQAARESAAKTVLSSSLASEQGATKARATLLEDVRSNLTSENIDLRRVAQQFGLDFDPGGGSSFRGSVNGLDFLSNEQLQKLSTETSALADAQGAVIDSQKALKDALKTLNDNIVEQNKREGNLVITVPVGSQETVFLP